VVAARVSLDGCLDLLNPRWHDELADAQFVVECIADGRDIPVNKPSGNRARDCATINWYCEQAAATGLAIRSVRAIFEEGEPIFEASAIRSQSPIQIAVRDISVILEIEEVSHEDPSRPDEHLPEEVAGEHGLEPAPRLPERDQLVDRGTDVMLHDHPHELHEVLA
jgi:hypothetical protein